MKIRAGEYAALEPDMLSGDFDAALLSRGYLVDVADPGGYLLSDWACDGGYNIAHYCDPETDQHDQGRGRHRGHGRPQRGLPGDRREAAEEAASVFLAPRGRRLGHPVRRRELPAPPAGPYVLTADLSLG